MIVENQTFRFAIFISLILTLSFLAFTYLFFEKYLTEKEVTITVINKEKFGDEEGEYLIFTADEVFKNFDSFYHRKTNAELLFRKLEMGVTYRVRVVGVYLPSLFRLRNITEILGTDIGSAK